MKLAIITIEKVENTSMLIIIWSGITNEWRKKIKMEREDVLLVPDKRQQVKLEEGKQKNTWINQSLYGKPHMLSFLKYLNFYEKKAFNWKSGSRNIWKGCGNTREGRKNIVTLK